MRKFATRYAINAWLEDGSSGGVQRPNLVGFDQFRRSKSPRSDGVSRVGGSHEIGVGNRETKGSRPKRESRVPSRQIV